MKKQMTRWGVGPQFTIISGVYAVVVGIIHFIWLSHLTIPLPRYLSLILGVVLLIAGLPIWVIPGLTIDKYFNEKKLATRGIYRYFRHPIYGSWIVFIIPGIVLIINSLIGLTISVFMYVVYKILIVEDDKFLRDLISQKLLREGFDVATAVDGEDGINKVKEEKPDLVLLDLILPGIDGFEVLGKIREDSAFADLPVIILSNLGQKEDIEKGIQLGAVDYLIKAHFTPQEVIDKIKGALK